MAAGLPVPDPSESSASSSRLWRRLRAASRFPFRVAVHVLRAAGSRCRAALGPIREHVGDDGPQWTRSWLTTSRVRWRRGDEALEVVDAGAGVVATLELVGRDTTVQLTPGPVPLAAGLVAVALYRQHGVTPQADGTGRAFVGVDQSTGEPRQVFETGRGGVETDGDPDVALLRVDCFRTLEEVPAVVDTEPLAAAYRRLSPAPTFDRKSTTEERV